MKIVMKKMILPLLVFALSTGYASAQEPDPAVAAAVGPSSTDCVAGADTSRQATPDKDQGTLPDAAQDAAPAVEKR